MKPKKLKALIKKTQAALRWPVVVVTSGDTLMITSTARPPQHIVTMPADLKSAGQVRDIEYLHELAHATLCETVHPIFSTNTIEADAETISLVSPAFRACSDWFADAWLMKVAPNGELSEIDEHLELVMRYLQGDQAGGYETLCGAALIIAQAVKYRGDSFRLGGQLQAAVNAFISTPCERPSVEKYVQLVNGLLAQIKMSATLSEDQETWRIQTEIVS